MNGLIKCRVCENFFIPGEWVWSLWVCAVCVEHGKTILDIPPVHCT